MKGIEPSYRAWEARILPLNYIRKKYAFSISINGMFVKAEGRTKAGSQSRSGYFLPFHIGDKNTGETASPRYPHHAGRPGACPVFVIVYPLYNRQYTVP